MSKTVPLSGLRVLITGGSSGIGLAVAEQLAAQNARLAILARGGAAVTEAAGRTGAVGLTADVTDPAQLAQAVDQAAAQLGGLDAVVACAGVGAYGPFADMQPPDYEQVVQITLVGLLNTAHAAIPHLEASRGTLVAIGSVAGRLPAPWLSAYAAAKHGVRGFMRSLDAELRAQRRPVSLALIAPGPVDTPFWVRARTPDHRLPPEIRGAYPADDVAREVLRALAAPRRLERTAGGLMNVAIALDSLAPNLTQIPLGVLARLGWRSRHKRPISSEDALTQPAQTAERSGGLTTRRSLLQLLRDGIGPWPT
ncbi:MAG TPA: SDR family NAD(P)-dependent oxidoreductase [Solirubrobacteraceae bacterium]|nr:SDR family NAD(P)-dependent oxidoreductase [Solirubrobacteraceae bacterium]